MKQKPQSASEKYFQLKLDRANKRRAILKEVATCLGIMVGILSAAFLIAFLAVSLSGGAHYSADSDFLQSRIKALEERGPCVIIHDAPTPPPAPPTWNMPYFQFGTNQGFTITNSINYGVITNDCIGMVWATNIIQRGL